MKALNCSQASALLSDLLAGDIDPESAAGVDAHMAWCSSCRREAEAFFLQDRMLGELAARQDQKLMTAVRAKLDQVEATPLAVEATVVSERTLATPQDLIPSPRRRVIRWRVAVLTTGLAVCVLIGLVWRWWNQPELPGPQAPQRPAVAKLDRIQGDVFVVAQSVQRVAQQGDIILAGEGLKVGEEGSAIVVCSDTTKLEINSLTALSWPAADNDGDGRMKVFLEEGALIADGAQSAAPMVLATAHAEVTAGKSRLHVTRSGEVTRIESERELVRVIRASDGQTTAVKPGEFVVARANDKTEFAAQSLPPTMRDPRLVLKEPGAAVTCLEFSADGRLLAAGSKSGAAFVWLAATGEVQRTWETPAAIRVLAFDAGGRFLVGASNAKPPWFGHLQDGSLRWDEKGSRGTIFALRFAADGKSLFTCGFDRRLRQWDVASARALKTTHLNKYRSEFDFPSVMAFSADAGWLAWGLKDNTARLWDVAAATERQVLRHHEGAVTALAFSADGKLLATGSRDRCVRVWDLADGSLRATFRGHRHTVLALAFHPEGGVLVSGSSDHTARIWDLASGTERAIVQGIGAPVQTVAIAPHGRTLAAGDMNGWVRLWDLPIVTVERK